MSDYMAFNTRLKELYNRYIDSTKKVKDFETWLKKNGYLK